MGPKKGKSKKPPRPPPEEIHLFHIKNFVVVETKETSLSVTPAKVQPTPDKTPQMLAAEQETTCGKMRMRIELNEQGCPDYQIKWIEEGDPNPGVTRVCEELAKPKPGPKKEGPTFEKEEHGLPDIKAGGWLKEPMTFPALEPREEQVKKKDKRRKKKKRGSKGKRKHSAQKTKRGATRNGTPKNKFKLGPYARRITWMDNMRFNPETHRRTPSTHRISPSFNLLMLGKNGRRFTPKQNQSMTHGIYKNQSWVSIPVKPCPYTDSMEKYLRKDFPEENICQCEDLIRTKTSLDGRYLVDINPSSGTELKPKLSHNNSVMRDLCKDFIETNQRKDFIVFSADVNFENVNKTPSCTKPTGRGSTDCIIDLVDSEQEFSNNKPIGINPCKDYILFPLAVEKTPSSSKPVNTSEKEPNPLGYDPKTQADFGNKPFVVSDIMGNEFTIDPTQTKRNGNYYIMRDSHTGDALVIDPPKLVVLDPLTERELVIDPSKPVGQNFQVIMSPDGTPIRLNTYNKQPYMVEDSVTGARLLKDNTRVKPYTVTDPQYGAEVRINPLKVDGKPYSYKDVEGRTFSIVPVVPGNTPILFEHPTTGETCILGGPVMIQDPKSGQQQYQEGPFTMRNPSNGQNINQIGPIMKKDPETGEVTVMANPRFVKDPKTGQLTLEPPLIYNVQSSGMIVVTSPDVGDERFKRKTSPGFEKRHGLYKVDENKITLELDRSSEVVEYEGHLGPNEGAGYELKLAPYKDPYTPDRQYETNEKETNSREDLVNNRVDKKIARKLEMPTIEKLVSQMIPEHRRYVTRTLSELREQHKMTMRSLIAKKKQVERNFLQMMLIQKEQKQNRFIQTLSDYFQYTHDEENYNKTMFTKHVQDKLNEENELLVRVVNDKIREENNKVLDAMMINIENQKMNVLTACNPIGTESEYKEDCDPHVPCDETLESANKELLRALDIYKIFRKTLMEDYDEAIKRENALIRKEMNASFEKEKNFIAKNIDRIFLKITCARILTIPSKNMKEY